MEKHEGYYGEYLTWKEIEDLFNEGVLVLVPLGAGCKEHGLHLPMSTDKLLVEYFTEQIVQTHQVLVMSTITYNRFPAFLDYAGSTSLDMDLSTNMFTTICEQWSKQGARAIYFLNFGVSTNKPLEAAKKILAEKDIQMDYTDLMEFSEELSDITEQKGGTHADEIETSMMLHVRPDLVKMEFAKEDFDNKPGKLTPHKNDKDPNAAYSPTGAWGNPTLATAEKGKIIVERLVRYISDEVSELTAKNSFQGQIK